MEPVSLTAGAIASLAFAKVFETTIEKFTEKALEKIDRLREKIWDKLRGTKAESALAEVEKGSKADLDKVALYLQVVMTEEPEFAKEIETLAKEIHQEINIENQKGQNIQNVYGGKAEQNNAIGTNAPVVQGGSNNTINIH